VRLNPRTGEMKEWLTPHPKNDIHEILINPNDGMVWLPEHTEGGGISYMKLYNWPFQRYMNRIGEQNSVAGGTLTHSKPRSIRSKWGWMKSFTLGLN